MRRMYSEQELTKIIGEVFDAKLEAGAFDDSISDAVDAYLVEHPVDITALEGLDISVGSLTSTGAISGASASISGNASVGGNLPVTGNITGASIIENMSGYAFTKLAPEEFVIDYAGAVKNGNKLTLAIVGKYTKTSETTEANPTLGNFYIPASVANKLVPFAVSRLSIFNLMFFNDFFLYTNKIAICYKSHDAYGDVVGFQVTGMTSDFTNDVAYGFRLEITFLLNDSLLTE